MEDNLIRLKYEEKTYSVYYKGKDYRVSVISDIDYGDTEMNVTLNGKPVDSVTRFDVVQYFNDNVDEAD